jgi:hypothetical protein
VLLDEELEIRHQRDVARFECIQSISVCHNLILVHRLPWPYSTLKSAFSVTFCFPIPS